MHLAAIRFDLARDPLYCSEPFAEESKRLIRTEDRVNDGWVMTAFFRTLKGYVVEIMWISIGPLPLDADEDNDDEDA